VLPPPIPVLCPLSSTEFVEPPETKFLSTPLRPSSEYLDSLLHLPTTCKGKAQYLKGTAFKPAEFLCKLFTRRKEISRVKQLIINYYAKYTK